jgi:membrane-bound lytic murein transglycosylase F
MNISIEMGLEYRRRWFLMAGAAVALAAFGAEGRSLEEIQKTKELRACIAFVSSMQGKAEPQGCRDNCTMTGDTPDLVQAFAASLGGDIKVKAVSIGWEEQFTNKEGKVVQEQSYTPELFASATCDFYATGLAKNAWRSKKMDFVMVNPSRLEIVVNQSNKGTLQSPSDLKGKSVATYANSAYHSWILDQNKSAYKDGPVQMKFVDDENQAMKAVDDGSVDFTILVAEDALPMAGHQYPHTNVAFPVGPVLEMGWTFRKEDKNLQAAADRFLRGQRGDKNSLLNKQFKALYNMDIGEFSAMVSKMP